MSTQDLAMIEQILKDLLLPDNNARKEAEAKLTSLLANKEPLCLCLSQLLTTSTELLVQSYAAIIIRKLFVVKDDEISSDVWKSFKAESKTAIKANLLTALTKTTDAALKKKISNALTNVFTCVTENEEKWEELLRFVVAGFNLELNEANLPNIELCLSLLASIYQTAYDDLKEGSNVYIQCFANYFKSNVLSLKAKTVQCLSELLCSAMSKKEAKKFKEFMFNILETTLQCLNAGDNDNLQVCLESLNDLSTCEPKILRKSFSDLFTLMGKVIENKSIDDNLRDIAFELLIGVIEAVPAVIEKDNEKINLLVQALFKYAMEIDDTVSEDWLKPSAETYVSEEFIPESQLDEACSLLTRLFASLNEKVMLEIVSKNISELLGQSANNWKYKYIAYITIAEIIENVEDLNSVQQLIAMILADLNNQNVKIQYAALYCISEISDTQNPDFQNSYHEKVLPPLLEILKNSTCLRIQLQVCDALECFIEHVTDETASKYAQASLDVLFGIFIKDDSVCPPSLKESILRVVNEFIDAAPEDFKKYAEKCLTILLEYLNKIIKENKGKSIMGVLLETISTIGPLCPEFFKSYLGNVIDVLVQINISMSSFKDNIGNYLLSTWEKVIPLILANSKEKVPAIIDSLLTLLKKPPEMSISSSPESKIDVASFFKEDEKDAKTEKEKVTLTTSETEEFATFIEILNLLLQNCTDIVGSYVPAIYQQATVLLKYPNEEIQVDISETYSNLIKVLAKGDQALLQTAAKQYIAELVTQLEKEKSFTIIVQMLDSVREIISTTKRFLTTPEINDLSAKILGVFDRVEKIRISLLKQKAETEKEVEEDKKRGDNKINSDDEDESEDEVLEDIKDQIEELEEVSTAFNDFFGVLFDTHKELTLQIVEKILKDYLPVYFKDTSSIFEKKMGLFIIDDMVEFLGQTLLDKIWTDVAKALVTYADHANYEIRNAAAYGIGMFAQNTTQNFATYANDILEAVVRSLKFPANVPKTEKDDMKFSKDNSISALGKIIKNHGKEIDLGKWINVWLEGMPIEKDSEEGKIMNKFLIEILVQSPQLVMGEGNKNIGHIVMILAKGYNTDFSEEETDKKIVEFCKGVKANAELMNILKGSIDKMKSKIQNKVKELFKD